MIFNKDIRGVLRKSSILYALIAAGRDWWRWVEWVGVKVVVSVRETVRVKQSYGRSTNDERWLYRFMPRYRSRTQSVRLRAQQLPTGCHPPPKTPFLDPGNWRAGRWQWRWEWNFSCIDVGFECVGDGWEEGNFCSDVRIQYTM